MSIDIIVAEVLRERKLAEPDEMTLKIIRSLQRAKDCQERCYQAKIKKSIEFVKVSEYDRVPTKKTPVTAVTCKAVTLHGTPCKFNAVCNGLCKRHQIKLDTFSAH
jgi:hypothetical protein